MSTLVLGGLMVDPAIKKFLDELEAAHNPSLSTISIDQARALDKVMVEKLLAASPLPDNLVTRDVTIPGSFHELVGLTDTFGKASGSGKDQSFNATYSIPVRLYIPNSRKTDALILFYHGGGWVLNNIDVYDPWCRFLAVQTGCNVASVEYRRAPEYPFPTPFKDCFASFAWVFAHPDDFGTTADRIFLCGDSAGGNLAAAVSLEAASRADGPQVAGQFLIYPALDLAVMDTRSYLENSEGYLLTAEGMLWFRDQYLVEELDAYNPLASPLRAVDVSGLPPTVIITAEYDPLRDEGAAYAERLRRAGVFVSYMCCEELIHAFIFMGGISSAAATAVENMLKMFSLLMRDGV